MRHTGGFLLATSLALASLAGCKALKPADKSANPLTPSPFTNVRIAEGSKSKMLGPCEPSIVVNPHNTQNIAAGTVLDDYYWSNDGGKTWERSNLRSTYGIYGDPVLVADWKGNIYYAHLSDPEGKQWQSERLLDRIVIQKSTDGGKTYNSGSFCGMHHPKDQDKQWLVVDPATNHLFCTWTEFDAYNSHDLEHDHSRILFSKSTDSGETWSEALPISQFEGDCEDDDNTTEGAVPAVGPNGEIYVAWAWKEKIWFDRSLDGGKTWLDQDKVIAEQPGGWSFDIPGITRCNGMPVLVCDLSKGPKRGALYVNWADQRNGADDTDVWLAKSTDGGNTWSKPIRVNNDKKGKHQFLSWLAIDQITGYLYVVFYDRRNYADEKTDVYLAISKDGGKSFENLRISDTPFDPNKLIFFGDYNHISAHNGVIRPIWTRMEKNVLSVWTALIDIKVQGPGAKEVDD